MADAEYHRAYRARRAAEGRTLDTRRRKGDRHKPGRTDARTGRSHVTSNWATGNIRAWDGEGITLDDGRHLFVLLAHSGLPERGEPSEYVANLNGLSTAECLEFLTRPRQRNVVNVIYGGSYDVCKILEDLGKEKLTELWTNGSTSWKNYRVWYTWRRKFTVQRLGSPFFLDGRWNVVGEITLWDQLGFSQSTFVSAIRQWLGDGTPDLDFISEMKAGRSTFSADELPEIIRYNDLENKYLVEITKQCYEAHKTAGITLSRYDGAGATAAAMLRYNKARSYQRDEPQDVLMASRYAYAGGRIEACKIGNAPTTKVYRYDINSAYPSVIAKLPCLAHGDWVYRSREYSPSPFTVVHVRWSSRNPAFHPFFYRTFDGSILFPSDGEGWYWLPEILAAKRDPNCEVEVIESWTWHPKCRHRPFSWLPLVYDIRKKFKEEGNHAQFALKLGMNALYGKFAQQAGWRRGRKPTFHQLSWAGFVTSTTRAAMYTATLGKQGIAYSLRGNSRAYNDIIAFCTDGIYSLSKIEGLDLSDKLGEWSYDEYDGITIAQAGVYWLRHGDEWESKYRGFDQDSLVREDIVKAWSRGEGYYGVTTRFVGVGSAIASEHFWQRYGTFISGCREHHPHTRECPGARSLDIYPTGKRAAKRADYRYDKGLRDTLSEFNWTFEDISTPHALPWIEEFPRDTVDGIDIRIFEGEVDDAMV